MADTICTTYMHDKNRIINTLRETQIEMLIIYRPVQAHIYYWRMIFLILKHSLINEENILSRYVIKN